MRALTEGMRPWELEWEYKKNLEEAGDIESLYPDDSSLPIEVASHNYFTSYPHEAQDGF